jgi:hypothetical protein
MLALGAMPRADAMPPPKSMADSTTPVVTQAWDTYQIKNKNTGKCMAVWSGNGNDGQPVIEAPCNSTYYDQHWILSEYDIGSSRGFVTEIQNRYHTQKCLSMPPGTITDGVTAVIWTCDYGSRQAWKVDGFEQPIRPFYSGGYYGTRCLAFRQNDPTPRQLKLFGCVEGYTDQQWIYLPTSS